MSGFKLSTLFNSQRGFSLTEIMVGGGILAGVALASAQMFKDQKTAQRKVDNEQKLTIFHQGLTKNLTNSANCNATLKGFAGSTIPTNHSFSRLAKCTSNCEDRDGDQDHKASDVVAGADLIAPGSFVDGTRAWKLKSVTTKAGRATSGPVILKVDYEMNTDLTGDPTKGVKIVSKDIVLNARFADGEFQECVNSQESNINNLQSDFCKTLNFDNINSLGTGGTQISNSGQIARWNEKTQTCEMGIDKDCSAQGLMVDGIDSNGRVMCRPLATKESGKTMKSDTTSKVCASGAAAQMIFNNASKRFEIVCP